MIKRVLDVILKNTQHGIHALAETLALVFNNDANLYYKRSMPPGSKLVLEEPYAQLPVRVTCHIAAVVLTGVIHSPARTGRQSCWKTTSITSEPMGALTRCWH